MNLKKPISAAMAAVMTLSVTATPALAAAEDPPGTATQADETETNATLGEQSSAEEDALNSSDTSEKSHQDAKVYASANGSYILTVPESINLHNVEKKDLGSGLYTNDKNCKVNLRGDVRQDQVVVVTVTEPVMQSEGSKDVDATVDTSSKTVWNRDDMFTGATAGEDGSYTEPTGVTTVYPVSAELTPGDWVGTAMFNCSLETTSSIASVVTGIDPPSFDYDGQEHTPGLVFADGSSLVEGKDYVISGDTAKVDEGDYSITVSGAGKYIGSASFDWKIRKYDITSDISASLDKTDFVADDTEHAPNIIWGGDSNLVEGADYEISGTKSATDPGNYQITITGKGKYKGTLTLDWTISATDIATVVEGLDQNAFANDDTEHTPNITWKDGKVLIEGKDYELSGDKSATADGSYTITITGKGNYTGKVDLEWRIAPKTDIASISASLDPTDFVADDDEHSPTIIWPNDSNLVKGVDYEISGTLRATDPGNYTITITGKGKYKGTLTLDWTISATDIASIVDGLDISVFEEDGATHMPNIIWKNGASPVAGKDYEISGTPSAVDGGDYTITITGKGKYKGTADLKWKVTTKPDIASAVAGLSPAHFDYDGQEHSPVLTWNEGFENLIEGQDYVISGDVTKSENGNYTLTVTGRGKYKGATSFDWNIRELIPVGAVYTIYSTKEQLTGDGISVYFPLHAEQSDTYTEDDYKYTYSSGYSSWDAIVKDKTKASYNALRSYVCDKFVERLTGAFSDCTSLTEAPVIPDSVTRMEYTFENCKKLATAPVIPDSVTNIERTFNNCTSLRTYTGSVDADGDFSHYMIPNGVIRMGCAFQSCKSMVKAPVIPNKVKYMHSTFQSCTSLTEAPVIPDSVTDMDYTFYGCTSLTEAPLISNGVVSMMYTFRGCKKLARAPAIPDSVTNMFGTFQYCASLTEAPVIPCGVTDMGYTFFDCTSLKTYTASKDPDGDFSNFIIPDSVTNMEATYSGCEHLTRAPIIPSNVTNMGAIGNGYCGTFARCTSLVEAPVIPNSVISMYQTFVDCTSLKTYTGSTDSDGDFSNYKIPDSVTCMYRTFQNCSSLVKAPIISNSVTDMRNTFYDCTSLTEAPLIPNNVTSTENTFRGCASLKTYAGSVDPYGDFSNFIIPDSVTDMDSTFSGCTSLVGAPVIPDGVTSLYYTFYGCKSLVKASVIPDSVTEMNGTFEGCTSLKTYTGSTELDGDFSNFIIPDGVTYMGATFFGCSSLVTAPVIPENVTNMGDPRYSYFRSGTFEGCTSLSGILVCNANPTLYNNALKDTKITTIEGTCEKSTKLNLLGSTGKIPLIIDNTSLANEIIKFDGYTHTPQIQYNNTVLTADKDYTLTGDIVETDCGEYNVTMTGIGKYVGKINFTWYIANYHIEDAIAGLSQAFFDYDGNEHAPSIKWNDGLNLIEGQDYAISGTKSAVDKGTYTVTVRGLKEYGGNISYTWSIGELMPTGAVYTVKSTGKKLIGDGLSVGFPSTASDNDIYEDADYKYTCSSNTWSVVVKDKTKASYSALRSYICDKPVTDMKYAFRYCASLTEAPTIPDSVTNMVSTFKGCTSLTKAPVIPNSVTSMGGRYPDDGTFQNCTSLTEAPVIPDSVTNMNSTFSGCTSLKTYVGSADPDGDFSNYVIPNSVTKVRDIFAGCTSLTEAPVIPDGVTDMDHAFYGCTSLVGAPVIPDGVISLYYTFYGCTSLTEAPVIPSSVTSMSYTFQNCTSLTGTLICNANPQAYWETLSGTKITAIKGSCSDLTKRRLLDTF